MLVWEYLSYNKKYQTANRGLVQSIRLSRYNINRKFKQAEIISSKKYFKVISVVGQLKILQNNILLWLE